MNCTYPISCFSCLLLKTVLNRPNLSSADPLFTGLYSVAHRIMYFSAKVFKHPQPATCMAFAIYFSFQLPWLAFLTYLYNIGYYFKFRLLKNIGEFNNK